jgi:salicylate 5-hydroxylase small subunit
MDAELQRRVEVLYANYAGLLDDGPLEDWPSLFSTQCLYLVIPRENFDQDLPLAIIRCESRAMLEDRVRSVRETIMHEPRYLRHQITNILVTREDREELQVQANYCVTEVLQDELPRILSVGRFLSVLERQSESSLLFRVQRVIYDSVMVPNTIVYPL